MRINLELHPFTGEHDFSMYAFNSHHDPRLPLIRDMLQQVAALPAFQHVEPRLPDAFLAQGFHPSVPEEVTVEVVLIDNPELLGAWSTDAESSLGLFTLSAGAFELLDQTDMAARHRIVICLDEAFYREHVEEMRGYESDPEDDRYDSEYMRAYLATVTHELAHAREFIAHANGMAPAMADAAFEDGLLTLTVEDLVTGNGILFPFDDNDHPDAIAARRERMERRVEEQGRAWLDRIRFDSDQFQAACDYFAPKSATLNFI